MPARRVVTWMNRGRAPCGTGKWARSGFGVVCTTRGPGGGAIRLTKRRQRACGRPMAICVPIASGGMEGAGRRSSALAVQNGQHAVQLARQLRLLEIHLGGKSESARFRIAGRFERFRDAAWVTRAGRAYGVQKRERCSLRGSCAFRKAIWSARGRRCVCGLPAAVRAPASARACARAGHPRADQKRLRWSLRGSWAFRKAIWSARMLRLDRIRCSIQLGR